VPTPEVERALTEGAARSRAAAAGRGAPALARPAGVPAAPAPLPDRLAAWYRSLPPRRRAWLAGLGLFLLLDLIAGLAAAASNGHF